MLKTHLSLIGVLLLNVAAMAQEFPEVVPTSQTDVSLLHNRIEDLEARLQEIESYGPQATQWEMGSVCDEVSPCLPSEQWLRPTAGIYGDAEILLLQWYDTDGDDASDQTNTGSRYTLGYMNSHGRTIRARYFEFAADDDAGPGQLLIDYFDLEYAARFALNNNWLGEISLGGRWASLENPTPRHYETTLGPVVGINLRSEIRDWLSVYGSARQSFQFGTEEFEDEKKTFGITELSVGVELSYETCVREFFVRSGVEAQYYTSVRDDEEDIGLVGYTFAAGVRY